VADDRKRLGVGKSLVQEAIARRHAKVVLAETDAEAIDFYIRCGFAVISLGENYPGVERFACRWSG
jgi:ribosomal protein S18 acetylase RimI-like enzyme